LSAVNTRIATGVPNSEMMKATAAATMTALTGCPPQRSATHRRAASRPPPRSGTGSP
jgi:hypothetical protein